MRKCIFTTALLLSLVSCKNKNNDMPSPDPGTGDMPTDVIVATNSIVSLSDLPNPDTTASFVNYPQVLMQQPAGARFQVPQGFAINLFGKVSNGRRLTIAPNGDVFVAQTASNTITILRDSDNNGVADQTFVWDTGGQLDEIHGMVFNGNYLYVGATEAILRYNYTSGQTKAGSTPVKLADLPGNGQHVTRNLVIKDNKIYVSIGSSQNAAVEADQRRTTIQQYNLDGSGRVTFASGLRNPVGMDVNPVTNELWTTVIERDGLGDELVPDYLTSVKQGGFYGYPYAYLAPNKLDPRIKAISPLTATTITPSVLFRAHMTPLGVIFYRGTAFPEEYRHDAYITVHGSWNSSMARGYKILRVRMNAQGAPIGGYEDFVTGWHLNPGQPGAAQVFGRPSAIVEAADGSILISDDANGTIWRIRYKR